MNLKKNIEIINKKATHEYSFIYTLEAGIILQGTEIKSIRSGKVNMSDAYCIVKSGELYVNNMHISEYKYGTYNNHIPKRPRKLLVNKFELKKLHGKVKEQGFSIVPYRIFISERGFAKLEIALAKGKKSYDKRDALKARDSKRDLDRMRKKYQ
ncbi:SsrA-binding protein SmpB [Aureispira anguillae]|uniref:SsrA-binding protein n=1 Tax=Aureispira anguillae TaxID=2864201 RepID=A0A915YLI7_9BACT|nr:SsrA-binding protein SmpB [Aureispira anguillae]BDS15300.1 SsrA-binding protein SmpB [Aureispira anguillae]